MVEANALTQVLMQKQALESEQQKLEAIKSAEARLKPVELTQQQLRQATMTSQLQLRMQEEQKMQQKAELAKYVSEVEPQLVQAREQLASQEKWARSAEPVYLNPPYEGAPPILIGYSASPEETKTLLAQYRQAQLKQAGVGTIESITTSKYEAPSGVYDVKTGTYFNKEGQGQSIAKEFVPKDTLIYQDITKAFPEQFKSAITTEAIPGYATTSVITKGGSSEVLIGEKMGFFTKASEGISKGISSFGEALGRGYSYSQEIRKEPSKLQLEYFKGQPKTTATEALEKSGIYAVQKATPEKVIAESAIIGGEIATWEFAPTSLIRGGLFIGSVGERIIKGQKVSPFEIGAAGLMTVAGGISAVQKIKELKKLSETSPLILKGLSIDKEGKSILILKGVKEVGGKKYYVDITSPLKISKTGYETAKGGQIIITTGEEKGLLMKGYNIPSGLKGKIEEGASWIEKAGELITKRMPSDVQKIVIAESKLNPSIIMDVKKTGILQISGDVEVLKGVLGKLKSSAEESKTMAIFKQVEKTLASGKTAIYVPFKAAEISKVKTIALTTEGGASIFKKFIGGKYPVSGVYRLYQIPSQVSSISTGIFDISKITPGVEIIPKKVKDIITTTQAVKSTSEIASSLGVTASKMIKISPDIKTTALAMFKGIEEIAPIAILAPQKEEQILRFVPEQKVKEAQIISPIQSEKTILISKQIQGPAEVMANIQSPVSVQIPIVKEISLQKSVQEQKSIQSQISLQKEVVSQKEAQQSKIIKTIPFFMKFIPTNIFTTKKTAAGISEEAFSVFVKRYGKYRKVPGIFTKARAIRTGESIALKTLARSFRIEKTSGLVVGDMAERYLPSPKIFRGYKIQKGMPVPLKDEWIQKAKYSLGTIGEKTEIKAARRKAKSKWL